MFRRTWIFCIGITVAVATALKSTTVRASVPEHVIAVITRLVIFRAFEIVEPVRVDVSVAALRQFAAHPASIGEDEVPVITFFVILCPRHFIEPLPLGAPITALDVRASIGASITRNANTGITLFEFNRHSADHFDMPHEIAASGVLAKRTGSARGVVPEISRITLLVVGVSHDIIVSVVIHRDIAAGAMFYATCAATTVAEADIAVITFLSPLDHGVAAP